MAALRTVSYASGSSCQQRVLAQWKRLTLVRSTLDNPSLRAHDGSRSADGATNTSSSGTTPMERLRNGSKSLVRESSVACLGSFIDRAANAMRAASSIFTLALELARRVSGAEYLVVTGTSPRTPQHRPRFPHKVGGDRPSRKFGVTHL